MIKAILIAMAIAFGLVNPAPAYVIYDSVLIEQHDEYEWSEFHADAYAEYADEFTALFNSYETKRARNGAMMIRSGNTGSFKFARKG